MFKNSTGNYKCICGKEFMSSQAFNGHKSHCKQHLLSKGYDETFLEKRILLGRKGLDRGRVTGMNNKAIRKAEKLNIWLSEKHTCEKCGKVMTEKFGSGRFCSRSCANSHDMSAVDKSKFISNHKRGDDSPIRKKAMNIYAKSPDYCKVCGICLPYEKRGRKCCSKECIKISQQLSGLKSCEVQSNNRRSKNEIYFYQKCLNVFDSVKHNEPIFNRWDADIIVDDFKIAILWNGIWHYKKIRDKHSVEQVQLRDSIKISNIIKCGYTPYIIKDLGSCNYSFVEEEFNKFIIWVNSKYGPLAQLVRATDS